MTVYLLDPHVNFSTRSQLSDLTHLRMSDSEISPAASFLQKQKKKMAAETDTVPDTDTGAPPPIDSFDSDEEDGRESSATAEPMKTLAQLWQTHETGAEAIAALQGDSAETLFNSILLSLSTLLPVSIFAYRHAKWKSTPVTSLTVFVAVFKVALPDIYSSVLACTSLSGPAANRPSTWLCPRCLEHSATPSIQHSFMQ